MTNSTRTKAERALGAAKWGEGKTRTQIIAELEALFTEQRRETLEEAARIAECWTDEFDEDATPVGVCAEIANTIRNHGGQG